MAIFGRRSADFEVDGADALDAFNHPYAYAGAGGANTNPLTLPSGLDHHELAG